MNKMKLNTETSKDEDFFGEMERARSNLGQLFGVAAQLESEQHTLKYTPPKQTTAVAAHPQPKQQDKWTTVLAKVASAYKQGESMGKVGVALLHNVSGTGKMILYKTKTNVLATLSLNTAGDSGQLHRQSGYLQFYDDEVHAWSLRFEKETEEDEFLKKLHELGVRIQEKSDKIKEKPQENAVEVSQKTETIVLKTPTFQEHEKTRESIKEASKSKLITRMAKVGQQLPSFAAPAITEQLTSEYSDSSDTEMIVTPSTKPTIAPRGGVLQPKAQILASAESTQMNAYSSTASMTLGSPMETQFLQVLLAENRTQNTEVRMNINKLEGKLEKVLDKIEGINLSASNHKSHKEDEMIELEEKLLALKKENRRLKQALEARTPPPPTPPAQRKEEDILLAILKTHKDDFAALNIKTSEDPNDFKSIINSLIESVNTAQHKLKLSEAVNASNVKKHKSHEQLLQEEQQKHTEICAQVGELEDAIKSLQEALKLKDQDYADLQQQLSEKTKFFTTQSELNKLRNEDTIKSIMNNLYRNLVGKIESVSGLHKPEILAIIGKTIRAEALKAIDQVKQ